MHTKGFSVIVIGAGIVGLAVAEELWLRGQRDIVVLDAAEVGAGRTRLGAGFIREWHSDIAWRHLATESRSRLAEWHKLPGAPLVQNVRVEAISAEVSNNLTTSTSYQMTLGESVIKSKAQRTQPFKVAQRLAESLRARGITIQTSTPIRDLLVSGNQVRAAITDEGSIYCDSCIIAVGGTEDLPRLGSLPVRTVSVPVVWFGTYDNINAPTLLDLTSSPGVYLTPDGQTWMATIGPPPYESPEQDSKELVAEIHARCARRLEISPSIDRVTFGCYDITADSRPIVGSVPELMGCFVVTGLAASGFQVAPAVARRVVDQLEGAVEPDTIAPIIDSKRFFT
ncbi:FAD-dependent oxidoreductase [Salinispora cortesiana]|uniref:NAD(P)/FAD-dependent oxidoreductase n=1 Tax=Salinispora cortesiana TaxID=1305843 RepID=UPI0009B74EFB